MKGLTRNRSPSSSLPAPVFRIETNNATLHSKSLTLDTWVFSCPRLSLSIVMFLYQRLKHTMKGSQDDPSHFDLSSSAHTDIIQRIAARAKAPRIAIHFEILNEPPKELEVQLNLAAQEQTPRPSASTTPYTTQQDLYGIASYAKVLINAAFTRLVEHPAYERCQISWHESACDMFNELRRKRNKTTIRRLWGNPTLRQMLSHVNGFAPMDRYLLAPDGACIMSEAEFIEDGPRIAEDRYKNAYPNRGWQEYSNGNHIFAGMILQEITQTDIHTAMEDLLFNCIGTLETVFSESALAALQPHSAAMTGHRVSNPADNVTKVPVRYLNDVVEATAFGARSSLCNIAKFNRELLKSITPGMHGAFSERSMTDFFRPEYKMHGGGASTLAGLFTNLDTRVPGEESSNNDFRKASDISTYRLGRRLNGSACEVYYKGGAIDGFAISVYLLLKDRAFLIVACNSSGPLDPTDHIARYILHETFSLHREIDFLKEVETELDLALAHINKVTIGHDLRASPSQNTMDLVGVYQHARYTQRLSIKANGDITVGGKEKTSSQMKLVLENPETFRICQGKTSFASDSWFEWQDLQFQIRHNDVGNVELVGMSGLDVFRRV